MKKCIVILLSYALIIQSFFNYYGCTSFYPSGDSHNISDYQGVQDNIVILLDGNNILKVPPGKLFYVDTQAEFTFGVGVRYNFTNKESEPYVGIINLWDVDSNKTFEYNLKLHHYYWMTDKTRLTFEGEALFQSAPDSAKPYWLAYNSEDNKLHKFYADQVHSIQVEETDWGITLALVLGLILLTTMFVLGASSWSPIGSGELTLK